MPSATSRTSACDCIRETIPRSRLSAPRNWRSSRPPIVKQQREIAHLQSFVDRFKAKATKARQAQSRIKALARMEKIAAAHVDTPFEFAFRQPAVQPDPVLTLDGVEAGYGDVTRPARQSA